MLNFPLVFFLFTHENLKTSTCQSVY